MNNKRWPACVNLFEFAVSRMQKRDIQRGHSVTPQTRLFAGKMAVVTGGGAGHFG
jgi:dihydroxyacetone kinase